jgi:hypothetical protein
VPRTEPRVVRTPLQQPFDRQSQVALYVMWKQCDIYLMRISAYFIQVVSSTATAATNTIPLSASTTYTPTNAWTPGQATCTAGSSSPASSGGIQGGVYQDTVCFDDGDLTWIPANSRELTVWNILGSCLSLRLVRHSLLRSYRVGATTSKSRDRG